MNIGYIIHRTGEWTMLMLGETVLSLLIVEHIHDVDYYTTFYCGLLGIVLLEYLHFRSQPSHAHEHAVRRGPTAGLPFSFMSLFYSAALIILGASYKMFLYEYQYEEEDNTSSKVYPEEGSRRNLMGMLLSRLLAGEEYESAADDMEDRRQRIAYLFCGSMAAIWFFLDAMSFVNRGLDHVIQVYYECRHRTTLMLLFVVRAGLIVWFATLCLYVTDPKLLSSMGLVGIVAQLILRAFVQCILPRDEQTEVSEALNKTLEYATARLRLPAMTEG
jgi:hypothetical protein